MRPTNTLVMWSGGIDSTYVLAHLLKETNDNVFAHHIYLNNCEGRASAEALAVRVLGNKLAKIRDFKFTHNTIDDSNMPTLVYDMARVCFEAGAVSKAWYWHKYPQGRVTIDRWMIGTHEAEGHNWERWNVIKHSTRAAEYDCPEHLPIGETPRENFIEFELHPVVSKKAEILYLKELGLLDDCWYCRTPIPNPETKTYSACGQCKTCAEVKGAL